MAATLLALGGLWPRLHGIRRENVQTSTSGQGRAPLRVSSSNELEFRLGILGLVLQDFRVLGFMV